MIFIIFMDIQFFVDSFDGGLVFALRVLRAVTRLTVYRTLYIPAQGHTARLVGRYCASILRPLNVHNFWSNWQIWMKLKTMWLVEMEKAVSPCS